ncbi:cellulose biosynthesis protein BcsE [Vibrio alginolyticus]|uniref:cellulose biosynthesis protein BcsE n=1 Tax=Vibrio alginolyticus TaxID=663 RepID=UPI001BD287AB|nr:cellulose biosynthesis protein BcsE [Vibrio alginolyticus]MBS9907247.1 cellulose biosynthesis protein BcsE [Vibrio alginolyticus]MBS9984988.1 cellulose biosynthesis protein BcsE [Vibrio alginolyticus]
MSAISGLSAITSEKEISSVYVNLFTHKQMVIDYLFSTLLENNNTSLTSFTDKETFLSALNDEALCKFNELSTLHIEQCFFLSNKFTNKAPNAINLVKDIYQTNIKKLSTYILVVPDSLLSSSDDYFVSTFLRNLNELANNKKLTISVCIYGHMTTSLLKPILISHNRYIAGLATMTSLDDARYCYLVDFWSNKHGVISQDEYLLSNTKDKKLKATSYDTHQPRAIQEDKSDSDRIYISRGAFRESEKAPKGMSMAESNQELIAMLNNPRSSTIVFSCDNQSEVQQIALDCYRLRSAYGRQLKIIVRETQQCLRYADEKFLLRSGANFISHAQIPPMRFMTQVEAIQGQMLTRPIPDSLEALLKYDLKFGSKGYLQNQDFSQYCIDVISLSTHSNVNFALIKLNLLPGMTAEECLRLCHIRRDGDVVTACNKALYVLFSAIRHSDIDIALNNIFEFPVRDLFHSTHTFDTQLDIETELKFIVQDEAVISDDVSALATERKIFHNAINSMVDVPPLFAVKKTIELKERS